jgi:murein DD-endopeptidase MepM/ murein hydrolase activator NlpD
MISKLLLYSFLLSAPFAFAQQPTSKQIVDLKNPRSTAAIVDTSPIYYLPFEKGTKRLVVQAAFSKLSHKGEIALDFKVKEGTTLCAARDGVVTASYGDSKIGGSNMKYINDGNHIIIEHSDGSRALYWHLQYKGNLVKVGDTVKAGQVIGKSGSTGLSAFPHLHFEINGKTPNGNYAQIPARFYTSKGLRYLKPLRRYKVT